MYIVLIAIGLFLVVITPISIKAGKRSTSWPTVPGTVLSSDVEQKIETDADDSVSVYYYPRVRYEYKVEGKTYQSVKYKLLDASTTKKKAQEFTALFLPGNTVTVHYNPAKPEEAVLQPGSQNYLYFFLVLGVALVIAGVVQCLLTNPG